MLFVYVVVDVWCLGGCMSMYDVLDGWWLLLIDIGMMFDDGLFMLM